MTFHPNTHHIYGKDSSTYEWMNRDTYFSESMFQNKMGTENEKSKPLDFTALEIPMVKSFYSPARHHTEATYSHLPQDPRMSMKKRSQKTIIQQVQAPTTPSPQETINVRSTSELNIDRNTHKLHSTSKESFATHLNKTASLDLIYTASRKGSYTPSEFSPPARNSKRLVHSFRRVGSVQKLSDTDHSVPRLEINCEPPTSKNIENHKPPCTQKESERIPANHSGGETSPEKPKECVSFSPDPPDQNAEQVKRNLVLSKKNYTGMTSTPSRTAKPDLSTTHSSIETSTLHDTYSHNLSSNTAQTLRSSTSPSSKYVEILQHSVDGSSNSPTSSSNRFSRTINEPDHRVFECVLAIDVNTSKNISQLNLSDRSFIAVTIREDVVHCIKTFHTLNPSNVLIQYLHEPPYINVQFQVSTFTVNPEELERIARATKAPIPCYHTESCYDILLAINRNHSVL